MYKAHDSQSDMKEVAVKIFQSRLKNERVLRESFNRELEALDTLSHPNIVDLIGWGADDGDGNPFVVLEWIGSDLLDVIQKSPPEGWDSFAPIALGILGGLGAIHEAGFVHRDIKPENVLMTEAGVPKIADLGISKMKSRFNVGFTLGDQRTEPYAPAEEDDGSNSFARDTYAFGVLVVRALCGQHLATPEDVRSQVEALDVPAEIDAFIRECLANDPEMRPQSGTVALVRVAAIQSARESKWHEAHMHLLVTDAARQSVGSALHIDDGDSGEYILNDLRNSPPLLLAEPGTDKHGILRDTDVHAFGDAFRYRLRLDRERGQVAVIGATRLPPSLLEASRERAWRGSIVFRDTPSLDPVSALQAMDELLESLSAHFAELEAMRSAERERQLFRNWQALLDAKTEVEDGRGQAIRYSSFAVDGSRIRFFVGSSAPTDVVGEPRMVRAGRGLQVFGEVEEVSNGELTLFVERGNPANIRPSGDIIFDAEASRIAIARQRGALEAIRHGRSTRRDLGLLLIDPSNSRIPEPIEGLIFRQVDIDEPKMQAVSAALGCQDLALVVGPPGTGKTTFIAELVAQFLQLHPGARVLLASQTHVALDNALDRIRRLLPDRRLVRIGRAERIGREVAALTLESQMDTWREEVLETSRGFLADYAKKLGIAVPEGDVVGLANRLRALTEDIHSLRSRIQNREAERRAIADEISAMAALVPEILVAAERVESAAASTSLDELRSAAAAYADRGLDLAARLEAGGGAAERLAEFENSLSDWRREVQERLSAEEQLRVALAESLGIDGGDSPPTAGALVELVENLPGFDDPRLATLQTIYLEWEQRFGRSTEFNGALMASADVVAATCVGLAGVRGTLDVPFDLCIVDEASKATATETLVPMSQGKRWILVGDPRQLPPFQEDALLSPELMEKHGLSTADLESTLFDSLLAALPPESLFRLTMQHRMEPEIGSLISEVFYGGELQSAPREPDQTIRLAVSDSPVLWISTSRDHRRFEGRLETSFVNLMEANVIKARLETLQFAAERSNRNITVAVLTGYVAQRDQMRRTFGDASWANLRIAVDTVDAFQGREAEVVFFSITRSNQASSLGFLSSERRINVALSRARDALVIVGDSDFVRQARHGENPLARVLRYMERRAAPACKLEEAQL